LMLSTG